MGKYNYIIEDIRSVAVKMWHELLYYWLKKLLLPLLWNAKYLFLYKPKNIHFCSLCKYLSIFLVQVLAIDRYAQFSTDTNYQIDIRTATKDLISHVIRSKIAWKCIEHLNDLDKRNRVILGLFFCSQTYRSERKSNNNL